MKLRTLLLLSFSTIIFSAIAVLSFTFYSIFSSEILLDKKSLLASVNALNAQAMAENKINLKSHEMKGIFKFTDRNYDAHTHALLTPEGNIISVSESENTLSPDFIKFNFLKRNKFVNEGTGHYSVDGQTFIWAINKIPDSSGLYLLQIMKEDLFKHNHSYNFIFNLIAASTLIMWFTVWTILIIASQISRKLNYQKQKLEYQADFDTLTQLPNRNNLEKTLQKTINEYRNKDINLALLLLDVNSFKNVNDTLGHQFGDRLLHEIAIHLTNVMKHSLLTARPGGDEFAVLLPAKNSLSAVQEARNLLDSFNRPIFVNEEPFHVDISIGIAISPEHGEDTETLLRHVETAMYRAKELNSGFTMYSKGKDPHSKEKLELLGELHSAIENQEFILAYQPKIDINTGKIISAEALLRWNHPEKGKIPPDEFIPLAEQTYLIKPMTRWVLENAMLQQLIWEKQGIEISVAVNLSAKNLHDFNLPDTIHSLFLKHNFNPSRLLLEITETAIISDPEKAFAVLSQLSEMGIKISLDDFGKGYTSLSQLKSLPVSELKIDQSFITNMDLDRNSSMIVQAIINMSHNMGFQVVAEGVENESTFNLLKKFNCDIGQGYYFQKPMAPEEFSAWAGNEKVK